MLLVDEETKRRPSRKNFDVMAGVSSATALCHCPPQRLLRLFAADTCTNAARKDPTGIQAIYV